MTHMVHVLVCLFAGAGFCCALWWWGYVSGEAARARRERFYQDMLTTLRALQEEAKGDRRC